MLLNLYFFKNGKQNAGLLGEDITPNGSLRRRRSRVPSEEDDNSLMDYLRTSGHADGSRERKSTGNIRNNNTTNYYLTLSFFFLLYYVPIFPLNS